MRNGMCVLACSARPGESPGTPRGLPGGGLRLPAGLRSGHGHRKPRRGTVGDIRANWIGAGPPCRPKARAGCPAARSGRSRCDPAASSPHRDAEALGDGASRCRAGQRWERQRDTVPDGVGMDPAEVPDDQLPRRPRLHPGEDVSQNVSPATHVREREAENPAPGSANVSGNVSADVSLVLRNRRTWTA
jgi:hypothetical protein